MAEYSTVLLQTVQPNQPVVYNETPDPCNNGCINHREGAGVIRLSGPCARSCQRTAKYLVLFGANIAVPAGGTAGAISLAVSIDGEPLPASVGTVTPAAAGAFFNIFIPAKVFAGRDGAVVSVRNISDQPIEVINANIIISREA